MNDFLFTPRLITCILFSFGFVLGAIAQDKLPQDRPPQDKPFQAKLSDYRLTAGDIIKITVFQNPDLTVDTRVPESGIISYPLIGAVQLGGLTPAEAERFIGFKLREGSFVQKPQVNILVVEVKGNQVSVLGLVNRPGRFPIETGNTRVSDMLAMAGGASPAGADTVILSGVRNNKPFRKEIDLPAMLLNGNVEQDVAVSGGDTIYVHRAPTFYIYGEVQRAGAYRLERNMTVLQGLAQGGGLTIRGTERGIRIHRRGIDGKVTIISPAKSDLIQSDDVIYVQEGAF